MTLFESRRYVGCTVSHHRAIGVHAGINARAGELWRNDYFGDVPEQCAIQRDAWALQGHLTNRIRIYQFQSKWMRRRMAHFGQFLANRNDC